MFKKPKKTPIPDGFIQPSFLKYSLPFKVSAVQSSTSPSSSGTAPMDFVYDPSAAVTAAPVYKTLSELMTAVTAGPQGARVLFTADATIPQNWTLPRDTSWSSVTPATGQVKVTVPAGVSIENLRQVAYGLQVIFQNDAPCLTWPADGNAPWVFVVGFGAVIERQGTVELAQIPDGQYGVFAVNDSPVNAVPPPAGPVFRGMGPSSVMIGSQIQCGSFGGILPGDFVGSGNVALQTGIDGQVLDAADFPGLTLVSQSFGSDGQNFGPQASGTALGVRADAPAGTRPTFQPASDILGTADVQTFDVPGTIFAYNKPAGNYRFLIVILQGGGGGGGGGELSAGALFSAGSGSGGGGGGRAIKTFLYSDVAGTVDGGLGPIGTGAPQTTVVGPGADGAPGGEAAAVNGLPVAMVVSGGAPGKGGNADSPASGGAGGAGEFVGGVGGDGSVDTGLRPASPIASAGGGGGSGGGYVATGSVASPGGQGSDIPPWAVFPGNAGTAPSGGGGSGNVTYMPYDPGTGGGGGGGSDGLEPGGSGGDGGPGSGGGGGGGSPGVAGGSGGNGGNPFVTFIAIP